MFVVSTIIVCIRLEECLRRWGPFPICVLPLKFSSLGTPLPFHIPKVLREVFSKAHAVVVASATLTPLSALETELGVDFRCIFIGDHIASDSQVLIAVQHWHAVYKLTIIALIV